MEAVQEDPDEAENDEILMQIWQERFEQHLAELGLSDLISEVKAALLTVGPSPFDHQRPDDRPVWMCIEEVSRNHHEHAYRIRAADSLAWADVHTDLGDSQEEARNWKEYAASDLEREKKERQITCDLCGADLTNWHCYSFRGNKMVKICWTCSTARILDR